MSNNIFDDKTDCLFQKKFSYEQFKSAEYILKLTESGNVLPDNTFFDVLNFLLGDLRPLLKEIIGTVKSAPKSVIRTSTLKVLYRTQEWDKHDITRRFDDLLEELPCITGIFRTCLMHKLSDLMKEKPYNLHYFC